MIGLQRPIRGHGVVKGRRLWSAFDPVALIAASRGATFETHVITMTLDARRVMLHQSGARDPRLPVAVTLDAVRLPVTFDAAKAETIGVFAVTEHHAG